MELLIFEDQKETIDRSLLQQIVDSVEKTFHETVVKRWFFYEEGEKYFYETKVKDEDWKTNKTEWYDAKKSAIENDILPTTGRRIILCDYYWQNSDSVLHQIFKYFSPNEDAIFLLYSGISTNEAMYFLEQLKKCSHPNCILSDEVWPRPVKSNDRMITDIRRKKSIRQLNSILRTITEQP